MSGQKKTDIKRNSPMKIIIDNELSEEVIMVDTEQIRIILGDETYRITADTIEGAISIIALGALIVYPDTTNKITVSSMLSYE